MWTTPICRGSSREHLRGNRCTSVKCQCVVLIVIFRLQLKQQQWLEFTADLGSVLGSVPFSHSAHFVAASGICSPFTNSWMSNTNAHTVKGFWGKAISIHGSNLPIQLQVPCVHVPSSETIIINVLSKLHLACSAFALIDFLSSKRKIKQSILESCNFNLY